MELVLFPRRMSGQEAKDGIPDGMVHPEGAPCPFSDLNDPPEPTATCCSLHAESLVRDLRELGEERAASSLFRAMGESAAFLAPCPLRGLAGGLARRFVERAGPDRGAADGGLFDLRTRRMSRWTRLRLDETAASLRRAATWYGRVANFGFGVSPRS